MALAHFGLGFWCRPVHSANSLYLAHTTFASPVLVTMAVTSSSTDPCICAQCQRLPVVGVCEDCRCVGYCSRACQKKHRSVHVFQCTCEILALRWQKEAGVVVGFDMCECCDGTCGTRSARKCPNCHYVVYCSARCQQKHWWAHK